MPKYDKKILANEAKEKGFIRDGYEKAKRLLEILRFINASEKLQDILALKGGTAINFTFSDLPRLSVDIDLDFAKNLSRENMLDKRTLIFTILDRFMNTEGYHLSPKSKRPYSLDSLVYTYINSGGANDNIKIEINYSMRCHILPLENQRVKWIADDDKFQIMTLSPIEIYAGKIGAFISRGAARDLFDLNGMIEANLFSDIESRELLRKSVAFYRAISGGDSFSEDNELSYPAVSERKVKTDLNPMLRVSEYFQADEAYNKVTKYLRALLHLTDREIKFGTEFLAVRYKPELLFDDVGINRNYCLMI
jgi:predicted nucleotidyltransferase component of viral defense system